MRMALDLAQEAEPAGEVPVGAVVVFDGHVIGRGRNSPIERSDPTAHAEILALREAAASTGNYRLERATLYATLEPCVMCAGALVAARVARLVFGARDLRFGGVRSKFQLADAEVLNHRVDDRGRRARRGMRRADAAVFRRTARITDLLRRSRRREGNAVLRRTDSRDTPPLSRSRPQTAKDRGNNRPTETTDTAPVPGIPGPAFARSDRPRERNCPGSFPTFACTVSNPLPTENDNGISDVRLRSSFSGILKRNPQYILRLSSQCLRSLMSPSAAPRKYGLDVAPGSHIV